MNKLLGPFALLALLGLGSLVAAQADQDSRSILMEGLERLEAEMGANEERFGAMKKVFYEDKRELFARWVYEGRQSDALDMLNQAQVTTLVESIRHSVLMKTLGHTRQMLGATFVPLENGMIETGAGVLVRAEMVPVLVERAVARATIEAERQSEYHWFMLYKVVRNNLAKHSDSVFRKLSKQACASLRDLRAEERASYEQYYATMKENFARMGLDPLQSKPIIDGLDVLIETALGCRSCARLPPAPEYLNTRPLFANDQEVSQAMSEIIDQNFMDSFETFDDKPDVYLPSIEEQNQVTRADVNALMQELLGDSATTKKKKASKKSRD